MARVLIVDDSAVDRLLMGGLLESNGFELEQAPDGDAAVARIEQEKFDLIVTDLHMPGRSGLDVVAWVRVHRPETPVVLVTSRGSEELALEALARGAAAYVPKSQLATKLVCACRQSLALAQADQNYARLLGALATCRFEFELPTDLALIDPLVHMAQEMATGMHLTDPAGRIQIGAALREALLNGMVRGNLEFSFAALCDPRDAAVNGAVAQLVAQRAAEPAYRERRLRVRVEISREEARFTIADDGPGFAYEERAAVARQAEPALAGETGRGLVLMHAFCDEVRFEPPGNTAVLIKRREAPLEQDAERRAGC